MSGSISIIVRFNQPATIFSELFTKSLTIFSTFTLSSLDRDEELQINTRTRASG